jgi:hypothetical protein
MEQPSGVLGVTPKPGAPGRAVKGVCRNWGQRKEELEEELEEVGRVSGKN